MNKERERLSMTLRREFRDSPLERRIIEAVSVLASEIVDSDEPVKAVQHVYALIESVHSERIQS